MRNTPGRALIPLLFILVLGTISCGQGKSSDVAAREAEEVSAMRVSEEGIAVTVVYDNYPLVEGLKTAWGFSCLIEGKEKTVLFDTGGDGEILLYNMSRLGIEPDRIDAVVLSHEHGDHIGGLTSLLELNPTLEVYVPISISSGFKQSLVSYGASLIEVSNATPICDGIWSGGELANGLREQALVVETDYGSLVITGCAHPGIVKMVRAAKNAGAGDVLLVMGGFHLRSKSTGEIDGIIAELKDLGVMHVGPCHCTGDRAIAAFGDAYGEAFVKVGVGKKIDPGNWSR